MNGISLYSLYRLCLSAGAACSVVLSFFFTPVKVFAAQACSAVFSEKLEEIYSLTKKINERYLVSMQGLNAISVDGYQDVQIQHKKLIRAYELDSFGEAEHFKVVEAYEVQRRSGGSPSRVMTERFNRVINQSIEFVLKVYEKRRKWAENFRDHLREQAHKYLKQTTIFQFFVDRELKGVLKIVEANAQRGEILPVDENLKINLPFNGDSKYELGNFAIERAYNKEAFIDFILQLMIHATNVQSKPRYNKNADTYYTYADEYSYAMYRSLGFRQVQGFEKPIEADGTSWRVMAISAEGILNMPEFMKTTRSFWEPEFLTSVIEFFGNLRTFDAQQMDQVSWSYNQYNISMFRPATIRDTELNRNYKYRRLLITSPGKWNMFANLPLNILPLQEGMKLSLQRGHLLVSYLNGKLKIIQKSGKREKTAVLTVDPDFRHVLKVETSYDSEPTN